MELKNFYVHVHGKSGILNPVTAIYPSTTGIMNGGRYCF